MSDFKEAVPPKDVEKAPSVTHVNHTEKSHGYEITAAAVDHNLKRQLKDRHVAMISIGGAPTYPTCSTRPSKSPLGVIGTGLFLGTAGSLRSGGPIGLLLGYIVLSGIPREGDNY